VPRRLINRATGRDVTAKVALVYPYTDLDIQRRELGRVTLSSRNGQIGKQVQRPARKATGSSRSGGETLAGNLYVQAGIFRTKGNAQKRASHLKRLGLSVRIGKFSRNGETMRLVLAGPYTAQADASAALQSVKRAGFSDAFVRK
ncbi:MAG: SPOR domain-containing protein, partial [Pseudomonadota bacterium]